MGAIASKKASDATSSRHAMTAASPADVSGPVATTPGDGSAVASSRSTVMCGCRVTRSCTPRANATRSTASAAPPGTRAASAPSSTMLPSRRISALSRPCALVRSTDLKELLQTSSASRLVWCAAVMRTGRIAWRVTATPRAASAQAASLPASPPPTTVAVRHLVLLERPAEAALRILGARDVRPEAAALHDQRAAAVRAFLLGQLRQVVHVVNQPIDVDRRERLRERTPEVLEHPLPRQIALLHLVQLGLHLRREADLEHVREAPLQHLPHDLALGRGLEAPVLCGGVPAVLQGRDDRRIRGRPPDPQALQLLHEARLAEARRRLGEVLVRRDLLHRDHVALQQRRDRRQILQGLALLR